MRINELKPISIAFIKGILSKIVDDRINYINALSIADERGIELVNTFNPQVDKYANLIDSYVYTKNKTINTSGTPKRAEPKRLVQAFFLSLNEE